MRRTLGEKRKHYYTMIQTYKIRRNELRKKYGVQNNTCNFRHKSPREYVQKANIYRIKIRTWGKNIRRIDAKLNAIGNLERAITAFTGIKLSTIPKKTSQIKNNQEWVAKAIYYKFGLERQMGNTALRNYIGLGCKERFRDPNVFRTAFTRSFKDVPKNKETWVSFKTFYENEFKDSKLADKRAYGTGISKRKDNATYP